MSRFSTNTNAHHLHDILAGVRGSGKNRISSGWNVALGETFGSAAFASKHAEVVNLLTATCQDIESLTEQQRARVARYLPSWWSAIVYPGAAWNQDVDCKNVISSQGLDMLAVTADLIAGTLAGSSAAPRGDNLPDLKDRCVDLLQALEEIPQESISESVRDQLLGQVRHLIWLIDNVALFGGARVAQRTEGLVGSLAQAVGGLPGSSPTRGRIGTAIVSLMGVLFVFNQGVDLAQVSIENAKGVVHEITQTYEDLTG